MCFYQTVLELAIKGSAYSHATFMAEALVCAQRQMTFKLNPSYDFCHNIRNWGAVYVMKGLCDYV